MRFRAFRKRVKRLTIMAAVAAVTLFTVRVYDTQRGPALEPWHTEAPPELEAAALDHTDWAGYLKAEQRAFDDVYRNVTQKLDSSERLPLNRYFEGSPIYPEHFRHDWNRSYELVPPGKPRGAVVMLHGLTDSPYSLRHLAEHYRQRGWLVVGIRLPAHGTVPGALTRVSWEDWLAATRLAVREARAKTGPEAPLQLVGFSNGGALAMKYTLDSLQDKTLARPQRVVLISPMIGVTAYARFAGIAGWPAVFPPFAKAAWLSILPEFNPFKYNSFPVNGARQSWQLTQALQQQIAAAQRGGQLAQLPPVLTFQSVLDSTVSTRAVVEALYNRLPANGSELVLFDINRRAEFGPLLRPDADTAIDTLLPAPPRRYTTTVISNAPPGAKTPGNSAVAVRLSAGQTVPQQQVLGIAYPPEIYSLSHVALPFPPEDSLYGRTPVPLHQFGISFGTLASRGERGALVESMDALMRISSNPFYPYLLARIDQGIAQE